jgi:hypothetical protein
MTRYRSHRSSLLREEQPRADRTTLWLLVLILAAVAIALSFGDAEGSTLAAILM